jgi:hypothetical protein
MNPLYILCSIVLATAASCTPDLCDSETVEFELAAPGDAVEIVLGGCPDGGGASLSITLSTQGDTSKPLAVNVDGVPIDADGDEWAGNNVSMGCGTGERVTVRRLDNNPEVSLTGTVSVEMYAPPRGSCTAEITVTPQ